MNKDNRRFLESNGIVPETLERQVDCNVYSAQAVNRIVAMFGVQADRNPGRISIADIVRNY